MENITMKNAIDNIMAIITEKPTTKTQQQNSGTLDINQKEDFYEYLDKMAKKEVREAVKYFSKRFRITEDNPKDEFVLMTKEQVALFNELKVEPYGEVKVRIEYMDNKHTQIYCYILYREHNYVPSYKTQAKLKNIK